MKILRGNFVQTNQFGPSRSPLVGRAPEQGRLTTIYRQASREKFLAAALIGEAGMEKTQLADSFIDALVLDLQSSNVLRGRAFGSPGMWRERFSQLRTSSLQSHN
jgi:hypothetical protein